MQALRLSWKGGIFLQQFCILDILSFIQLHLKPPNSLVLGLEEKKGFQLGNYIKMVSFWKIRNEKVFHNENPNFRSSIRYLKKHVFLQFKQIRMRTSPSGDNEFSDQNLQTLAWYKPLPGTIKFNFEAKYKDENFSIATFALD